MNEFPVRAFLVEAIRQHPHADNLTVVKLTDIDRELIANKKEDGTFRYVPGESLVIYYPVGAILPQDALEEMGAWKEGEDGKPGKGTLGGNKGNRVTARKFPSLDGGEERYESRGALRPVLTDPREGGGVHTYIRRGDNVLTVEHGTVVQDFLGITQHGAA